MKIKVLTSIFLIFVINVSFFNINKVQAEGISDVVKGGDSFISSGKNSKVTTIDESKLQKTSNTVYNILLIIGMCVAVIISGILGIKFMIGSIEEKAQIKEALIPFIIGCVVIFGAFGFWKIAVDTLSRVEETQQIQSTSTPEEKMSGWLQNAFAPVINVFKNLNEK